MKVDLLLLKDDYKNIEEVILFTAGSGFDFFVKADNLYMEIVRDYEIKNFDANKKLIVMYDDKEVVAIISANVEEIDSVAAEYKDQYTTWVLYKK